MSHLLDIVAIAIVLVSTIYAARALLPNAAFARISISSAVTRKSGSCGSCDGCATDNNKTNGGCH